MVAKAHEKGQRSIYFFVMNKIKKYNFHHFKKLYQNNKFDLLFKEKEAIYWLKLRSISRKALLLEFCKFSGIKCSDKKSNLFEYIYKQKPESNIFTLVGLNESGKTTLLEAVYLLQFRSYIFITKNFDFDKETKSKFKQIFDFLKTKLNEMP